MVHTGMGHLTRVRPPVHALSNRSEPVPVSPVTGRTPRMGSVGSVVEPHALGEAPPVGRMVDADVLDARLLPERVEQAVVVVGYVIARVHRDVELVRALNEIDAT